MKQAFYGIVQFLLIGSFCLSCSSNQLNSSSQPDLIERNAVNINMQDKIEGLLNTQLPNDIHDLNYFKFKPSDQLDFYTIYIKFGTSKTKFLNLMQQMNMHLRRAGGEANLYLPAAWAADSSISIPWWNPSQDNPEDYSAAKSFGSNGWIVAKYENESVYIIVTETGFPK